MNCTAKQKELNVLKEAIAKKYGHLKYDKTIPKKLVLRHVEHFGVSSKENIVLHIRKLEAYLEQHPNDIEVRTQLAKFQKMFNDMIP